MDIFKNNEYKVDSLKQNFANKIGRRRAKMNLEKAITKNFFESTNLFDVLINAKSDNSSNQSSSKHKKDVKFLSPRSSFKKNSNNSPETMIKDVKETQSSSTIKPLSPPPSTTTTAATTTKQNETFAMLKLTNKIKKAKELKTKKVASAATKETDATDYMALENTQLLVDTIVPQNQEMIVNRSIEKTTVVISTSGEPFTERITEV